MSKRALIIGIAGQDGSYLAEYLLQLGYEVHGLVRRNSSPELYQIRLEKVWDKIDLHFGDLTDFRSVQETFKLSRPDEVYNLGAQSHVRISFDTPVSTTEINAVGVLTVLEAIRMVCPHARFYQASSSEMFGNSMDSDGFQRETTPMHPVSPYGCSKLFGYSIVRNYRNAYGLFACNGILFNHESKRRASNFVTGKVVKGAVEIKLGIRHRLEMGDLDSRRDWGHASDYVRAMHLILNHSVPDDFVIATGISRSIRDLCQYVFGKLNLDYQNHVVTCEREIRAEELRYLKGDCTKARIALGWIPRFSYEDLLDEMIEYWFSELNPKKMPL